MKLAHLSVVACSLVLASGALVSCKERKSAPTPTAAVSSGAASSVAPEPPLPKLTATSGGIAIGNLDAEIESIEKRQIDRSGREGLIELLSARGQYLGRIADYERASEIAEKLVAEAPEEPVGLQSRAGTLSTFHRFDAALADLAEAEKHGASADKLAGTRASIYVAMGRYDDALALMPHDEATMTPMQLAGTGLLLGELGKLSESSRLLDLAREKYPDVSPFPLAWMDAQQAALFEKNGLEDKARAHYVRALAMLPTYARAAAHLAAISRPDDAVALLQPISVTSDDPEITVQLAEALRRSGRADEGASKLKEAIARYDELLQRHPEAFADHAAAMWLGEGRDPARALPLAKRNVEVRKTSEAYELLLTAALAAKDEAEACRAAREGLALKYASGSLRKLATPVAARCPAP